MGRSYQRIEYELLGPTAVGSYSSHLNFFAQLLIDQGFGKPTVLDVAAGSGIFAEHLNNQGRCIVTALDSSPEALEHTTAEKLHCPIEQVDRHRRFNGVHSKDAFGFDINPSIFLNIVSNLVTPSGILMICAVATAGYSATLDESARDRGFTPLLKSGWVPTENERDWYKARVPRAINYFVKN